MNKSLSKILMACIFCLGVFCLSTYCGAVTIKDVKPGEDVFSYITRLKGGFDQRPHQQVIGAANEFKEVDVAIAVGADNKVTRSGYIISTAWPRLTSAPKMQSWLQGCRQKEV